MSRLKSVAKKDKLNLGTWHLIKQELLVESTYRVLKFRT
ncbi:hypothetical protein CRENPOLYSF2_1680013 [Crenothrix polyspora]|uniref:Uncharacterized protein n=1 Tax=Crenothrix polyspora TaxID=360316 RepID=A0A1R4H3Q4_9GAMM|nr:hypothetical protein CRENPOLYSF2_1680013 [Crenothrix polyspora]